MAGSTYGTLFRVTTFGESHGVGIGAVVDGVPAGLSLTEADIQPFLDRRKPGQSAFTTARKESDTVEILSGVFEGKTTGTPIGLLIRNGDQRSKDYSNIAHAYRPGHADYGFMEKYGFRDYRGGGRSSGRETAARVAAGAIAEKMLSSLGIQVCAYTKSIGPIAASAFDRDEIQRNAVYMPDKTAAEFAQVYLKRCMEEQDSAGGVIECVIDGMPAGVGEPVFDKLDAELAKAVMSIGAVKGFEIGDGFNAADSKGSENNDPFAMKNGSVVKASNHSGGTLGGMSDGSQIVFRAAIKPTPSISRPQQTVNEAGEEITMEIQGRHDPVIVPRAVVVVESMAAVVLADQILRNMTARMDTVVDFYRRK